ncbi:MAG: EAL domain-containing protein [Actinobacteria bacterium]|nr:EAL domain-containing protein [Actinomycetota bacterium]MCL6105350.1 EAL domain-containing protein [Actinomycetota bacterium]
MIEIRHRTHGGGSARQDYSGVITKALVGYTRSKGGDSAVDLLLSAAGEKRSASELEDTTTWSSYEQVGSLFDGAIGVLNDSQVGIEVGKYFVDHLQGTDLGYLIKALGSPTEVMRNIDKTIAKFSTIVQTQVIEVGVAHAVIRSYTTQGIPRHPQLCNFTKSILSQIPVLFDIVPATVTESECQVTGGRYCLYSVAWEASQWSEFVEDKQSLFSMAWQEDNLEETSGELNISPEEKVQQLTEQIEVMADRLQGVYSTAAELLSSDDLDIMLRAITAQAAYAVNAPKYLLVVQTSEWTQPKIQQQGFSSEEAETLATELLTGNTNNQSGSRLIADIASSHRSYGKIAAIYPEGMEFFSSEQEALTYYANYAAIALDVITTLEEARKRDATARALLQFGSALAKIGTRQEVVQQLANTVPTVLGCQSTAVMLWKPELKALQIVARSNNLVDNQLTSVKASTQEVAVTPESETAQDDITPEDLITEQDSTHFEELVTEHRLLPLEVTNSDGCISKILRDHSNGQHNGDNGGSAETGSGKTGGGNLVIAPLVSNDNLIGAVSAHFKEDISTRLNQDADLLERLQGLADQAVTALVNAELMERTSHMAWHDALTGLPNRRLLEDRIMQALIKLERADSSLCLFFVDLDHFKQVNDTLGHQAGDDLIIEVADRLVKTLRHQDTIARVGGDEFVILLSEISDKDAIQNIAQKILDVLSAPYKIANQEVFISASIGITRAPEDSTEYEELLQQADSAMYDSKESGRNTFHFFQGQSPAHKEKIGLETDLHHALENNQIHLAYQPIIELDSNETTAVEVLLRWHHPSLGSLEAEEFINIAEQTDLIVELDNWMLKAVCAQLGLWTQQEFGTFKVSVNISSRDLNTPGFIEKLKSLLKSSKADPKRLELEITERVIINPSDPSGTNSKIDSTLNDITKLGISLAIDDFGLGNSALHRLDMIPAKTLKIDKSFIDQVSPEAVEAPLIEAIISLSKHLNLYCIVEGVEHQFQHELLKKYNCPAAQGFFYSYPLSSEDFTNFVKTGTVKTEAGKTETGKTTQPNG